MKTAMLESWIAEYINQNSFVRNDAAINPTVTGMKIFDTPITGYADPGDILFTEYREKYEVTYGNFIHPFEWLENARTVISIFFPYTQIVKSGNARDMKYPSAEWLHARVEGQQIINKCTSRVVEKLQAKSYKAVAPSLDKRFLAVSGKNKRKISNKDFYSNWSERHVAFAAGLGTFGLSKGLITAKGITGRFSSIITDYEHPFTQRNYTNIYEYCNMCGKCTDNCPVKAISFENGKDHTKCSRFIDYTGKKSHPRYGCGKCQVDVPCSNGIPLTTAIKENYE